MGSGGKREGAGRKKNQPEDGSMGKGFASRVLSKIGKLELKDIANAEEYALEMLRPCDGEAKSFFKLLLAYKHGKPVQPTIQRDTREDVPDLEFDGLRMPDASPKPKEAGKPN